MSHWDVSSDAAKRLITKTFEEMQVTPKIGHSEALRRAMLDIIKTGNDSEVHPAYWAPFFLVGEGAADVAQSSAVQ